MVAVVESDPGGMSATKSGYPALMMYIHARTHARTHRRMHKRTVSTHAHAHARTGARAVRARAGFACVVAGGPEAFGDHAKDQHRRRVQLGDNGVGQRPQRTEQRKRAEQQQEPAAAATARRPTVPHTHTHEEYALLTRPVRTLAQSPRLRTQRLAVPANDDAKNSPQRAPSWLRPVRCTVG